MANATREAGISGRKTNHSVRKTCVKRLSSAGVAPHKIAKLTGHQNAASLQHYDHGLDLSEQKQMSHILSDSSNVNKKSQIGTLVQPEPARESFDSPPKPSIKTENTKFQQMFAGAIMNNCTLNINLPSSTQQNLSPTYNSQFNFNKQRKYRRIRVIDSSDSSQELE